MKTITEFDGFRIAGALKALQEATAAGKTPEEAAAGIGEAVKLEGGKLKFFLSALEVVKQKPQGVKRVVVLSLAENEKAPQSARKIEDHYFVAEYFPSAPPKHPKGRPGGEKRGKGRDGKRRGKGKRGDRRGPPRRDKDGQAARAPAPEKPEGAKPAEKPTTPA